jgi:4-hydroxy-tetrahydrodipicolinate reductase
MMSDMRLVVAGAGGRMGRTVIKAIAETDGVALAGAVEGPGSAVIGRDAGELAGIGRNGIAVSAEAAALLADADGLVDFTTPAATVALAEQSAAHGLIHIIGTTGFTAAHEKAVAAAATRARIVKSGNMSLGVNLLAALARQVAKSLDDEFDIEIFEMHHNKKVDAPSGTALFWAQRRLRAATSILQGIPSGCGTATPAPARPVTSALRACAAAPSLATTA